MFWIGQLVYIKTWYENWFRITVHLLKKLHTVIYNYGLYVLKTNETETRLKINYVSTRKKKVGKWVSLCCTVCVEWIIFMDVLNLYSMI